MKEIIQPTNAPQSSARHSTTPTVFTFLHSHAAHLRDINRLRASEMLTSTLNHLIAYRSGEDLPFASVDTGLLQLFQTFLALKGLKRNTIGFYMRTLRSACNVAVERGLATDTSPFRHVYTGKDRTVKRALKPHHLRALISLDLSASPHLAFARDMFLFSFYARGMAFVDMAFLRKTDLQSKHFVYRRRKTGQLLIVEWLPEMQRIVDRCRPNPTQYLLPIITATAPSDRRQYLTRSEAVNHNLKAVASLAGIDVALTMYWARHTWSTMARDNRVPISVISEALGHDSERTTQIYLDSIHSPVIDRANRLVIKALSH